MTQSSPACVYRQGRIVCRGARVRIDRQTRQVGLTPRERQRVRVVFAEDVSGELQHELAEMVKRRGAAAARYAERIEPVTIVVDDGHERMELRGRIKPPIVAHAPELHQIEFPIKTGE